MTEPTRNGLPETTAHLREQAGMSEATRRDMLRTNTAVIIVLVAVLALALLAVFAALIAAQNVRRAEAAEADSRKRLHLAYTEGARAFRVSSEAGGRAAAMNAISNAAAIRLSPELRTEAIACLALSDLVPDGPNIPTPKGLSRFLTDSRMKYFAFGDGPGNVLIHSLVDGRQLFVLDGTAISGWTQRPVGDLSISPDSSLLAARFDSGTVVVWNLETRKPIFWNSVAATNTLVSRRLTGLAFSSDSTLLTFGDLAEQGNISIYNVITGQRIASGINVWGKTFRVRPDLKQVAIVTDNRVDVLDFPSGVQRATLTHAAPVQMIEWSPDNTRLAVSGNDGGVLLWDPEHKIQQHFTGHSERGLRLAFNSTGTLFFSSSRDGTTRLWDVRLGRLIAIGEGMGCTFTSDDQRIIFWKPWAGFGTWRILPSNLFALHECPKSEGFLLSIDLSLSGRWCAVTQTKGFRLWDLSSGDKETYVPGAVSNVRVSMKENAVFVCSDGGLEEWPFSTNVVGALQLSSAQAKKISLPDGLGARAVALSQDDHWAAVELTDRRLVRIDLTAKTPPVVMKGRWRNLNFKGPASATGAGRFAISPDGNWVVTGFDFESDTPKVWNGNSGELAAELPTVTSLVCFSPDGRWLGLAGISHYSIWSVGDWKLQKEFARDEASLTHAAFAFMPDDKTIAVSQTRQRVQLRDWRSNEKIGDLVSPVAQSINSVRLSLDGSTLVMATASDMVEVWRMGQLRKELTAMKINWGATQEQVSTAIDPTQRSSGSWKMIVMSSMGGSMLVALLVLLTLRRHHIAIKRFVVAEADAAERNRELDVAKVELMHSQKMQALGTLATGISHDFNNLLSVVRMSNKLIGRQAPADAGIQEHVADIEQAVLQGKSVVNSILGYARPEKDSGEPTDLGTVVEEAVSLLSREFLSGIALTLELERNVPKVEVPRGPLEQILLNLLVNASEAMHGEGRLKISLHSRPSLPMRTYSLRPFPAEQYLELSVIDSGPGIAPEIRDRLFEPFFTTKRSGAKAGTGLGLSLVYSLAQQAGLGLSIESDLGKGANFTVTIPIGAAPVRQTHSAKLTDHP
ncbi:MAG: putative Histidine kinase [Verrucomicrobiales bacterium]|nr:putative Histidine kinase [Verrucomicrobiales bacterium]